MAPPGFAVVLLPWLIAARQQRRYAKSRCGTVSHKASGFPLLFPEIFRLIGYRIAIIRSFSEAATARLFADEDVPRFRAIERQARRKLLLLDAAGALNDLRQPPGNRLEAVKGDQQGTLNPKSTTSGEFALCGATAARSK